MQNVVTKKSIFKDMENNKVTPQTDDQQQTDKFDYEINGYKF